MAFQVSVANLSIVIAGISASIGNVAAETVKYACKAWGGSHTSRYTFSIDPERCVMYWQEIDRRLETLSCNLPVIVARKPFAPASGYELRLNLQTGAFSDHVPGWTEYGECKAEEQR